ncbi:hypothetical protein VNO78_13132 [Psophocarpus tetragonolobus]|uniref:Uncharacterized protein n=1 Tax=Psophocarpus tetragonolobus TaxID=3891 RepID=A0AAN9XPZ0_PSOTE
MQTLGLGNVWSGSHLVEAAFGHCKRLCGWISIPNSTNISGRQVSVYKMVEILRKGTWKRGNKRRRKRKRGMCVALKATNMEEMGKEFSKAQLKWRYQE